MKKNASIFVMAFFFGLSFAFAEEKALPEFEEDVFEGEELTIVGTEEKTQQIKTVTKAEIAKLNPKDLPSLLEEAFHLSTTRNGAYGSVANVSIRGFGSGRGRDPSGRRTGQLGPIREFRSFTDRRELDRKDRSRLRRLGHEVQCERRRRRRRQRHNDKEEPARLPPRRRRLEPILPSRGLFRRFERRKALSRGRRYAGYAERLRRFRPGERSRLLDRERFGQPGPEPLRLSR